MKVVVVLLFIALVGVFAWISRTCWDGDLRIERELSADLGVAQISSRDMTNVAAQVDHLDVVLTGTVERGRRLPLIGQI